MMNRLARIALSVLLALGLFVGRVPASTFLYPITTPIKLYTDSSGKPLQNGFVYIGVAGQNPETTPVTVYWDAAGTQPAAQPLRTVSGYIARSGTPANVFVGGDISITVREASGKLVFNNPTSVDLQLALAILAAATNAVGITIADAGNYYITKNVEAALQQIGGPSWVTFTQLTPTVQQSLLPTGAVVDYCGVTAPSGFVFGAGKTIGSAASSATERANADTAALYTLLWNSYDNTRLPIQDSAGTPTTRGSSASNDFAANKRLPTPDYRERVRAGLGTMSSTSDPSRLTAGGAGIDGTVMGNSGGAETHALTTAELASHAHSITDPGHSHGISDPGHNHTQNAHNHSASDSGHTHAYFKPGNTVSVRNDANQVNVGGPATSDTTVSGNAAISVANATATNQSATTGIGVSSASTGISVSASGSGAAHTVTQPTIINTVIIKL